MAPLVKRIAYHFMARLPASVQVDDLIQAGLMGLLDAAKNFDDTQGAQFETYAIQRIRGSMLDELRQADWLPRNVRKNLRRIEATMSSLEQRLGRTPKEQELADELGVGLDQYQTMLVESRGHQLLHYEDFQESEDSDFFDVYVTDNQTGPLEVLEDDRFRRHLVQAISALPEREKIVMGLYYEQEMNLKEIGQVLGVSESRVCQLHMQAVARLRSRLKPWYTNPFDQTQAHSIRSQAEEPSITEQKVNTDQVQLALSAPRLAARNQEFVVRFVAYLEAEETIVATQLSSLSRFAVPHVRLHMCQWRTGTRVQVKLSCSQLRVENASQSFVWRGAKELINFAVQVKNSAVLVLCPINNFA
jgi:RNA polymerase sigma factor for flagellar operon FliA